MKYSVLVVDDSAFMRKVISDFVQSNPMFQVVATARNGRDALEKVKRFQPSVVTMDVEMPEMDGVAAVRQLMQESPVPVIMISTLTGAGTYTTLEALQAGAVECFSKDRLLGSSEQDGVRAEFFAKLEAVVEANVTKRADSSTESTKVLDVAPAWLGEEGRTTSVGAVVIGCSTGGPAALQRLLPQFPANLRVPVIVVQHMPRGFTRPLADRMNSLCAVAVKEAEDGDVLRAGTVYIAPAGSQTVLQRHREAVSIQLTDKAGIDTRFHPSVDVTLLSAVAVYGPALLAVVLTGMGNDGTLGCKEVQARRGQVLVESEETCVVYGMPKSVYEAGVANQKVPIGNMAYEIGRRLTGR